MLLRHDASHKSAVPPSRLGAPAGRRHRKWSTLARVAELNRRSRQKISTLGIWVTGEDLGSPVYFHITRYISGSPALWTLTIIVTRITLDSSGG